MSSDELLDVLASMHHFSNGGHEFEPMSVVDLNKMLGLKMLQLDRETHEIWTVNKLAIILIDALRHSFEGFSRSRLDEPVVLQYIVRFGHQPSKQCQSSEQ